MTALEIVGFVEIKGSTNNNTLDATTNDSPIPMDGQILLISFNEYWIIPICILYKRYMSEKVKNNHARLKSSGNGPDSWYMKPRTPHIINTVTALTAGSM
jgi:hypothetical protein